jgi:hypothetical protein
MLSRRKNIPTRPAWRQIQRATRAKGDFLAMMRHEIRTRRAGGCGGGVSCGETIAVAAGRSMNMQSPVQRKAYLFLLCLLTVVLVGCPQQVKIGDLTSNAGRYADKEVTITGTVASSFGLLGPGAFEVDDGTGKIWVLSESFGVPSKGARVGITGRVTQGLNVGGRSFAVVLRQTHKPHY